MPSKKRPLEEDSQDSSIEQVTLTNCPCGQHPNPLICQRARQEKQQINHLEIGFKVIASSPSVVIEVGKELTPMTIHRGLLALHSQWFRNRPTQGRENEVNVFVKRAPQLPDVKASEFAVFCNWAYTGQLPATFMRIGNTAEELWQAGHALGCPDFQNACLDIIRTKAAQKKLRWPLVSDANLVYEVTKEGSQLRQLVAGILAKNSPIPAARDEMKKEWFRLYKIKPELAIDIAGATAIEWKGFQPWSDYHRSRYIIRDEKSLAGRYTDQILKDSSEQQIYKAAETNWCKVLERDHLEKVKRPETGVANGTMRQPVKLDRNRG